MCRFLQEVSLVHTLVVLAASIIEDLYCEFDFESVSFVINFDHALNSTLEAHILAA